MLLCVIAMVTRLQVSKGLCFVHTTVGLRTLLAAYLRIAGLQRTCLAMR